MNNDGPHHFYTTINGPQFSFDYDTRIKSYKFWVRIPKYENYETIFAIIFAKDYKMEDIDYIKFDPMSEENKMP